MWTSPSIGTFYTINLILYCNLISKANIKTIFQNNTYFVVGFSPDSQVAKFITVNDEIIAINSYRLDALNPHSILKKAVKDAKTELEISFFRDNQLHTITTKYDENQYPNIKLTVKENASEEQNIEEQVPPVIQG